MTYAKVINKAHEASTNAVEYGNDNFAKQLSILARMIKGGIGTKIFGLAGFIPPLVGVGEWFALAFDVGPFYRVFGVDLEPPVDIELCIGNDGLDRALRFAVAAIDTLVRVDHQHVLPLVEIIHGANLDAVHQFALDTALK